MSYSDDLTVDGEFQIDEDGTCKQIETINRILDRFASFSGLNRNTIKSQIYSHTNSPKIIALGKKYGLTNVTDNHIRILGAQFTPSSPDNTSQLFENLKTRMQRVVQRFCGLGYRARVLITNSFLITIPLFHLQYLSNITVLKLKPLQSIIDKFLRPGMSNNQKYLHIKNNGLSNPNLMTYYIDFKIKRLGKLMNPISIFDQTIADIFIKHFNLPLKTLVYSGPKLITLATNISKELGFAEIKEACKYFGTYQRAEMNICNIIPTFANENDTSMYNNPTAMKNLLRDKDSPSPRNFTHLIHTSNALNYLNYIVAKKTQNSYSSHIHTTPLNDNNTYFLMDRTLMSPRLGVNLTPEQYNSLRKYISLSHKETFKKGLELETCQPSFTLNSLYNNTSRKKPTFKRLINNMRYKQDKNSNQLTQRHERDGLKITPSNLAKSLINIAHQKLACQATNNSHLLLTHLILSPHKVSHIEGVMERPCTLCFLTLGEAYVKDQIHCHYSCLIPIYLRKLLTLLWYKHSNISINTSIEAFYFLQSEELIIKSGNDKQKIQDCNKPVLLTFITAQLIIRKLTDKPEITSNYTALKHFIVHHFRTCIDKTLWPEIPDELLDHTKFANIPLFADIENPPFFFYAIQMTNYHYNKLRDEINKKMELQKKIQELGYKPEEDNKPNDEQMRRTQITYNQALALLAINMQWNSLQIEENRKNFHVLWAPTQPGYGYQV